MAGLKGNVAWWALAKQSSGKGTAATSANELIPFSGGNIQVTRETGNLSETDSSRDQGVSYIVRSGVEGGPEAYVRDAYASTLLEAALGTDNKTGTSPNFTHTITPANDLSYYTIWRNQSNTLWEKFTDCMVSELSVKSEAGAPLTFSTSIMGRTPTRLTTDPTAVAQDLASKTVANGAVYNYNDATVTLGGSATALIRSFELSINNNVSMQQTDEVVPYDLVPGQREVTLSFDLIMENLLEYNKFFYGSDSGVAASSSIYTTSASFEFIKGTNNSIKFDIPSLAYEAFPVEPNPNGDPIIVSVRAQAQRGSSPVLTATVKNQTA